jgi:hypothetical protein
MIFLVVDVMVGYTTVKKNIRLKSALKRNG